MSAMAKMVRLYMGAVDGQIKAMRRQDDIILGILAGEPMTLFGKQVEFTLTWPEGRPFGYSEERLQEMAASWLRDRQPDVTFGTGDEVGV